MFRSEHMDAVILGQNIDTAFITHLEQQNEDLSFKRIDADLTDTLKEEVTEEDKTALKEREESITEIFRKALENDKLEIRVEKLKDNNVASMMTLPEETRRMEDMMKMYSMQGMDMSSFGAAPGTLILNANHPLVQFIEEHKRSKSVPMICQQLYDLAMISHKPLSPEEMTRFISRSNEIMMALTK